MSAFVLIVGEEIGDPVSGESRFAINLAKSIRNLGHDVVVCAAAATEPSTRILESKGIRVISLGMRTKSIMSRSRLLAGSMSLSRRLVAGLSGSQRGDWYVVFDQAVGAARYLPRCRKAFVCNGDFALLFATRGFYRQGRPLKEMLSLNMARTILRNAQLARLYDFRFANSRFTQSFMSYLYELPFEGVLYPPVDPDVFHPCPSRSSQKFALSLMRNANEQNIGVLEQIAARIPMKVVGSAKIQGAESTGIVSDAELARLYGSAQFLAFPIVSEFFGYAVAESIACATPALVMSGAGPSEIIHGEVTAGWVATNETDFVAKAIDLYENGFDPSVRGLALESSHRFSLDSVGRGFLSQLHRAENRSRLA